MNPALILTCNNLNLTKDCVASLRKQDIPVDIFIVDNGSIDGSAKWAKEEGILLQAFPTNTGFSNGMNIGLNRIFDEMKADYCLAVNNDVVLPPWYFRMMLESGFPIVSGVQHVNGHRVTLEDLEVPPAILPIRPHPDFSALLFRKEAWQKIGPFDDAMKNYSSDQDYHIRAHRAGIAANHIHVPFYHVGSATIRLGPEEELERIRRGPRDGEILEAKWGLTDHGGPSYDAMFAPELFGIDRK